MTGKELIFKVLNHEKGERTPWVPYAGIHAGALKGYGATEVLKDPDKLFESIMEANRLYTPDGQTVMFDLQLEAEILGCDLLWADENLPSVVSHPLTDSDEIPEQMLSKEEGRLPQVLDVISRFKEAVGNKTALYGLLCGPFTLANHLRGTRIFTDMIKGSEYMDKLMKYTTKIAIQMADYYHDVGIDIIVPVDPLMSQISPKHFERYFLNPYKKLFAHIRNKKTFSSLFVCGNATHNIDLMCQCGPDSIAVDENVDMVQAKQITDRYNVTVGGNIPIASTMLFGKPEENTKYVADLFKSLEEAGLETDRNLIIATGCDMPYSVPPENAVAAATAVIERRVI